MDRHRANVSYFNKMKPEKRIDQNIIIWETKFNSIFNYTYNGALNYLCAEFVGTMGELRVWNYKILSLSKLDENMLIP